jgi:hypothetical protein
MRWSWRHRGGLSWGSRPEFRAKFQARYRAHPNLRFNGIMDLPVRRPLSAFAAEGLRCRTVFGYGGDATGSAGAQTLPSSSGTTLLLTDILAPFAQLSDLTGLYQSAVAVILMTLAGRLLLAGREGPGVQLVAGWGALCLVLTFWGVLIPASLRIPAGGFAIVALAGLLVPRIGVGREDLAALGRILVLALPLLWITSGIEASQPDIFLNLMPNAAYLHDHAAFPVEGGPPAYSFLPVAPYNTQFVPFLGSLAGGDFAASGLAHFTILLHLAAGLLFARILAKDGMPGWPAAALGLVLATLLDPGFVPRVAFAGYGEAPLAICLLFAGWLASEAMAGLAEGERWPRALLPLALTLAALVDIKQQAIGLFAAFTAAMLVIAALDSRIGWKSALRTFGAAAVPAALLYLGWRFYVLHGFAAPEGELKPLPFSQWQWDHLPQIFLGMGKVIIEKPFHFSCVAAVFVLLAGFRRRLAAETRRVLGLTAIVFVLYTGFMVMTYVGHFVGIMSLHAHSYFRYNTHLSLLVVLGLVLAVRDGLRAWTGRWPGLRHSAGFVAMVIILVAPVAFAARLRFDREMPQPLVRDLVREVAARLREDDRILLALPGDNGSLGEMFRALLRFAPPRRLSLDIRLAASAEPAVLIQAASDGYAYAFLSCTDGTSMGLPPHAAALLARTETGWQPVGIWPYAEVPKGERWTQTVSGAPLCHP